MIDVRDPARSGASVVVALVDDDPDARLLLRVLLDGVGPQPVAVVEFDDGASLIGSVAGGRRVDVVVTDMSTPSLDGWQGIDRLRAVGYRGPIIVHSTSVYRSREELANLDVQAVFQKGGVTPDELVDTILTEALGVTP